jgi:tetratricopeptide (TPR) repeat protein
MISELHIQAEQCFNSGDYDRAILLYEQAIAAHPERRSNYWNLGLIWLLQGEELEAQGIWLSALSQGTSEEIDLWTNELLGMLLERAFNTLEIRQFERAELIYSQILALDSTSVEAYYYLGEAIAQQGRYDDAISCWQHAIGCKPDFVEAYEQQGRTFQKIEQFDEAIACYFKIISFQPDRSDIYYDLGLCLTRTGQWTQAIELFERSIKLKPDFFPAYGDLSYTLCQQGEINAAISCWKAAIDRIRIVSDYRSWLDAWANRKDLTDLLASKVKKVEESHLPSLPKEHGLDHKKSENLECDRVTLVEPPSGFYESTWDWGTNFKSDSGNRLIPIYSPSPVYLKPPNTRESSIHFSFRFGSQIQLPASFVATIEGGRYWSNDRNASTAIITPDGKILGDLSPEFPIFSPGHPDNHPSHHSILKQTQLPPIQAIEGTVAILSGLLDDVYFHWMFDVLPRIQLLKESGISFNEIDYFLVRDRLPFQQATLDFLGIPKHQRIQGDRVFHLQADRLIVPSFPGCVAWMPEWVCSFLRQLFLDPQIIEKDTGFKRLYISRDRAENRRIINEVDVLAVLTEFGFQSITLESMSVQQQAALLSQAEIVISAHGSGLTNLVFCNPGTKAIEIFSPNYVYPCYWLLSNLIGLDYSYILGEMPEGYHLHQLVYPDARTEDIWVNINELRAMLKSLDVYHR